MSALKKERYSCPKCGSSDGRREYTDGGSYCFSCRTLFSEEELNSIKRTPSPRAPRVSTGNKSYKGLPSLAEIRDLRPMSIEDRGISTEICELFGVKSSFNEDGRVFAHYYPYDENCYKVRVLPKEFAWHPKAASGKLFGRSVKFDGGKKRVTIVEGEIDALSVAQAFMYKYGKVYPVVSIPSASTLKPLVENREWLRRFDEVVLFFDNDEAGREACKSAAKIIGADKVKILNSTRKDANEVLLKDGFEELVYALFDADKYVPSGIIRRKDIWGQLVEYNNIQSHPYPPCLAGLNEKIKGTRFGEITLFISGTGAGKSTMLREIGLDFLETTNEKLGCLFLEESPAETARKFSGMVLNRNPAKEEIPVEDLQVGFEKVFGALDSSQEERVVVLDHQGSLDDTELIDKLEYMILSGCTRILIDHITILVSEGAGKLVGNEAQDRIMNDLLRLVKKYPIWIGLISHLRKTPGIAGSVAFEEGRMPSIDDIRGSGSIKQISFDIIAFARNMQAENADARNKTSISILKSRFTGLTGAVDGTKYNWDTGRLEFCPREKKPKKDEFDVVEIFKLPK